MNIRMAGIDYEKASIEYRELFSFTVSRAAEAMKQITAKEGISGCVILSTCSRTEIWISEEETGCPVSPFSLLCEVKELPEAMYRELAVHRDGEEAARHLFYLACGLRSRILGEDQIITQVKDAAAGAREAGCSDPVLEMLFRSAVTAAKKVKTQVHISGLNPSAADGMIRRLQEERLPLNGLSCLVIGNGQMGKLAAEALVKAGCSVTVTVRQYHRGVVEIPQGCRAVLYEDKLEQMKTCRVVVSATTSPHHTLTVREAVTLADGEERIFFDLAVPRDIEPEVGQMDHCRLYGIDDLTDQENADRLQAVRRADKILDREWMEFRNWYEFRGYIPVIENISFENAQYVEKRVEKKILSLPMDQKEQQELLEFLCVTSKKATQRMLFGLKETMEPEQWETCISGLYHAVTK